MYFKIIKKIKCLYHFFQTEFFDRYLKFKNKNLQNKRTRNTKQMIAFLVPIFNLKVQFFLDKPVTEENKYNVHILM